MFHARFREGFIEGFKAAIALAVADAVPISTGDNIPFRALQLWEMGKFGNLIKNMQTYYLVGCEDEWERVFLFFWELQCILKRLEPEWRWHKAASRVQRKRAAMQMVNAMKPEGVDNNPNSGPEEIPDAFRQFTDLYSRDIRTHYCIDKAVAYARSMSGKPIHITRPFLDVLTG